jgi:hypothetical protein
MRSKTEIVEKFYDLYANHLRQRKEKYLCRKPENCEFYYILRVKGENLCLCQNTVVLSCAKNRAFVCDESTSQRCKVFRCKNTDASVEHDFEEVLHSPARCGQEYPKLAVLVWCLQDVVPQRRLGLLSRMIKRLRSRFSAE